ncbi:hypothetical protein Syun_006379 [Stephania yunnanensis]|uniref:Uncharacterized protein n=1 Tax=Stephania yunnanensis TaxID=152371 RepID=A0AAP0KXX8_9MAGN
MVRPSKPTPTGTLNLSVIDKVIMLQFYVTALFVFRDGNENSANIIKEALSKALVPYYPLAGRLQDTDDDDDNGEGLHISCTGEGVWFVEACANCSLADLNYLDEAPQGTQEKLIPYPFPAETMDLKPIMLIQVTSFKCGGFVTAGAYNHCTCDGTGIYQFLSAVGEFARGLERPSVEPLCGWLVEAPLAEVVKLVQEAKAKLQAQYNKWMFNEGNDEVELIEEPFTAQLDYATLLVSYGENIGLDSMDYGWGPPVHGFTFLPPHPEHMYPTSLLWPPMKPKTGIRLRTWCVDDSHLQALKDELINLSGEEIARSGRESTRSSKERARSGCERKSSGEERARSGRDSTSSGSYLWCIDLVKESSDRELKLRDLVLKQLDLEENP